MLTYYITIFLTFIFASLAQLFYNKQRNMRVNMNPRNRTYWFFVLLTAGVLIFVAGFRFSVGTDYWGYYRAYDRYINQFWISIITYDEPGIKLIAKLSSYVYNNPATLFFFSSLITVGLSVKTISKYSDMFLFSILLYFLIGPWYGSLNGVRQYLALAVLFAGHRFIIERNIKKYALVVLLAGSFHITALLMIVLYFIPLKKLKLKHILVMIAMTLLILASYGMVFKLVGTLKNEAIILNAYMTTRVNILRVLVSLAPVILYVFLRLKKTAFSKTDYFYINIMFVNVAIMFATLNSAYLARFGIYTNIYVVLGLPVLLRNKNISNAVLLRIFAIICYSLYGYIAISKSGSLNDFQWIFNHNLSI